MNGQTQTQNIDYDAILNSLPPYVQEEMYSETNADVNKSLASKYQLNQDQKSAMLLLIARTIMKLVPIIHFHDSILTEVRLSDPQAKKLAIDIATQRFLTIRTHLPETINLINTLGGQVPSPLPPLAETKTPVREETEAQPAATPEEIVGRDIGAGMTQNEKVAIQIISEKPIKLADSPSLRTPSIGNWLADYAKYKSQSSSQDAAMIRIKYIHDSPNAKGLAEQERNILNFVLKSFDEHTLLPFSKKTGLLSIEKLIEAQAGQKAPPPKPASSGPPSISATPKPTAPPVPKPSQPYIAPPPVRPAPSKQMPPADTRIINLSQQQKSVQPQPPPQLPPQQKPIIQPPRQTPQQKPLTEGNIVNLKETEDKEI